MALRQQDFDFVQKLIQDRAAIVLDNNKHYFVESRLGPVVEEAGLKTIEELVQMRDQRMAARWCSCDECSPGSGFVSICRLDRVG